jgi:hypothetical protein
MITMEYYGVIEIEGEGDFDHGWEYIRFMKCQKCKSDVWGGEINYCPVCGGYVERLICKKTGGEQ